MANAHLASLSAKHAQLESQIMQEVQRPAPDNVVLGQLKKQKLRIKEEMLRRQH